MPSKKKNNSWVSVSQINYFNNLLQQDFSLSAIPSEDFSFVKIYPVNKECQKVEYFVKLDYEKFFVMLSSSIHQLSPSYWIIYPNKKHIEDFILAATKKGSPKKIYTSVIIRQSLPKE